MQEKGNYDAKASIFGGILALLSTLVGETIIRWYLEVAGGLGLIIYGISRLVAAKKR